MKKEQNKINFLDITIQRTENNLSYSTYRKSTATDTIIHNTSCHPTEHKTSAINNMINNLNTCLAEKNEKNIEKNKTYTVTEPISNK
jgi:hypothetical protein